MKLLAIRLDAAGDVLMCAPALRALAEAGHQVTLLTSAAGALAGERLDSVDRVLCWSAPWMKASVPAAPDSVPAMAAQLASAGFDGALIFTSYSQSPLPAALLCQMAGIKLRAAHCRENPYQLLTHWLREPEPETLQRHEVQRQIDLVAHLGWRPSSERMGLRIGLHDREAADEALRQAGIDPAGDWILLHPGASAPSRRYPAQRWRQVAELLEQDGQLPLVFAGSSDELPLLREIFGEHAGRWPSVAGRLDFGGLTALISRARVLVCCNSAPAHLAAATGTPVVDLYALTNPQHTPWQVRHRLLYQPVPCHTCYQSVCPRGDNRCLSEVAPVAVRSAVQELLAGL